ncbi:MAG: aspartyl/asparaginyl beta-hydroxylase domain-containing protein [Alphaproteobacteria bacterium]|nr:aspartyl/asparaginyl beta-hydroxylase domain-containing protein [Alphaproteobacteria bacterium]MBU2092776.1 aspartyl/asparaginyl beta-hydroxylase domain-containing protein [Alphaproteobacteria bacterium]MBU2153699.1 aspartyl/asparaginyl beta-hydroxylase domain-containing protein [Alphaproteobacteria bacterium]
MGLLNVIDSEDLRIRQLVEAMEPGDFRAMLQTALHHEGLGETRAAAATYRTAMQAIPKFLSPALRPVLDHAKAVVDANDGELARFLDERLDPIRARHADAPLDRVEQSRDILLRRRRVFRPQPSFMYVPQLPAIEFYDRDLFPWLDTLEAATADIQAELTQVLAGGPEALEPYIAIDGTPQPRWRELANSRRWGVFYLWRAGAPVAENLARCPKTARALESWPQCRLEGTGPTAVFSILDSRTRIPPHVGVNNARLIVHVPLVVPPGCGFRVGAEQRSWEPGKAFVFDDTIEHEAWNDSDQPRAVLILDCWNPFLSAAEREMVTELTAGVSDYYGDLPGYARGAEG